MDGRRTVNPRIFFTPVGGDNSPAIAVCATCPVRRDCLKFAVDNNITDGIFAGTTPRQRKTEFRDYSNRRKKGPDAA